MTARHRPLLCLSLLALVAAAPRAQDEMLSRVREGGAPPDDPRQSLQPFAVTAPVAPGDMGVPTCGYISSPPEYTPTDGVLFRYSTGYGNIVTALVASLTGSPTHDEKAYVIVNSASAQTTAAAGFAAAGADLSKVVFYIAPTDSVWIRDYGPHFIWQDEALGIADSHYYPTRPLDNFIPTRVGEDHIYIPPFHMGLYYSGGNFQPGPNRSGFITNLIYQDNPDFSYEYVSSLYQAFQGVDTLHVFPRLPSSVDGTGHIDMWMYLVDEDSVIISEFLPGSNPTAIQITNEAVPYMQALGFTVHRPPAWNVGSTHYTYANAFRVNDRIFVPIYGPGNPAYLDDDALALAAWGAAAGPGVEIVPINSYQIIPSAGAVHCIIMQVPRRTAPVPAAHIVEPGGGELLVAGTQAELIWSATDDIDVASVDLAWSLDGGATYPWFIATSEPDDGHYDWSVPFTLGTDCKVQVTAYDAGGNSVSAASVSIMEICDDAQSVYDFSVGAGTDRWAWGNSSTTWADVNGQQHPAAASTSVDLLKPGAYAAMAASDATGSDTDANRYISALPGTGKETTHVFEFTLAENRDAMREIELDWEGYGDDCIQMELYVWDRVLGNWGDGHGHVGENAYVTTYAGNRDDDLVGHLQSDFDRYVSFDGRITFLLYGERSNQESFHDAVTVTVTYEDGSGQWKDLGFALAGTAGEPALEGHGLLAGGDSVSLNLDSAKPLASAALVAGLSRLDAPFKGGVLVPSADTLVAGLSVSPAGALALTGTWPVGLPPSTSVFMQVWISDSAGPKGWSASNAIAAIAP